MPKFLLLLPLLLLTSCQRHDEIQTYRVSKEVESSMPMAAGMAEAPAAPSQAPELPPGHPSIGNGMSAPAGGDMQAMGAGMTPEASPKEISWKVPSDWREQAPTSIRVGSFLIKGANGQSADMSVIPLSGMAGGDLANINRWRGQINLGPISEADLTAQSETVKYAGRSMLYVDFVSGSPVINNQFKKRLMAAIYHRGERTWFFKMVGEDTTVLSAKPAFQQFLKSLKFND
jgi:hypothetical protein